MRYLFIFYLHFWFLCYSINLVMVTIKDEKMKGNLAGVVLSSNVGQCLMEKKHAQGTSKYLLLFAQHLKFCYDAPMKGSLH